jgi:hypothetical protein
VSPAAESRVVSSSATIRSPVAPSLHHTSSFSSVEPRTCPASDSEEKADSVLDSSLDKAVFGGGSDDDPPPTHVDTQSDEQSISEQSDEEFKVQMNLSRSGSPVLMRTLLRRPTILRVESAWKRGLSDGPHLVQSSEESPNAHRSRSSSSCSSSHNESPSAGSIRSMPPSPPPLDLLLSPKIPPPTYVETDSDASDVGSSLSPRARLSPVRRLIEFRRLSSAAPLDHDRGKSIAVKLVDTKVVGGANTRTMCEVYNGTNRR